jgi:hypothetical protein
MKVLSFVVTCLVLVGCKHTTKEMQSLADRACECADGDTACGSKVLADVKSFAEHNSMTGSSDFNQAGARLTDCLTSAGVQQHDVIAALEKMDK